MILGAAINAICPYYTMFPLSFPMRVIKGRGTVKGWVVDPFCGRGTTNLAARLFGLPTLGIDSSPIAAAIASAKLCSTSVDAVTRAADYILDEAVEPLDVPDGAFWRRMYHPDVLQEICTLREAFLLDCRSDARKVLRAILLGALHGPLTKETPSHLSNQCPRTYAPKPDYALRFWRARHLHPPKVDVREVIRVRATRYLEQGTEKAEGLVKLADSRLEKSLPDIEVGLAVTSPPYYGMRTYVPDQWVRSWFLGGTTAVDYQHPNREVQHASPKSFADDLRRVWKSLAARARADAQLVVRFGGINDRAVDHVVLMKESLRDSGWKLTTVLDAGDANTGKRQADYFLKTRKKPQTEYDYYARIS